MDTSGYNETHAGQWAQCPSTIEPVDQTLLHQPAPAG
jgi:hypothetical protein